jgi:citrate synthase
MAVVDELLSVAGARVPRRPNVDFALGALAFVSAAPIDLGQLFCTARIAGWIAHALEEYAERPVRFRANGRYIGPEASALLEASSR